MKYSQYFMPTLKEDPADAEIASHRFMLRSGMIRKVAAGIYDYLPLGLKAIRKVENIVREEMNRAGAIELLMPMVLPAEHWKESGRWDFYGKELLRFKDRAEREFCLGPTHEEIITDIVRRDIKSYRQLPVNLYQIQTKFRDEIRPRFGVMRAREFIMKDAYSFDANDQAAEESYSKMFDAYKRIFERCGLEFRSVEADTGNIGGSYSHEFMVLAPTGEDVIVSCGNCDYAANLEMARIAQTCDEGHTDGVEEDLKEIHTPGMKTVEEVAEFTGSGTSSLIKTMIVNADGKPLAALVRGDHELSLTKLRNFLGADNVELADEKTIRDITGGSVGFSGPVGLSTRIVADNYLKSLKNGVTGANKADYHLTGVNSNRDYNVDEYADIRVAIEGDGCPECGDGTLSMTRGIEVGHVFKLGTKYSEAMNATFSDIDGKEKPFIMGCYGIGIGRTVAAAIEQNNEEGAGPVFPLPIAPFEICVIPLNIKNDEVTSVAEKIYNELLDYGFDVVIDDRDVTAGIKFNDADLTGAPVQITVGQKSLKEGCVEIKDRRTDDKKRVKTEDAVRYIREITGSETTDRTDHNGYKKSSL